MKTAKWNPARLRGKVSSSGRKELDCQLWQLTLKKVQGGWLGGPDLYVQRFGHPRLRARHLPYAIGIAERDQWLACMGQAMAEQAIDPALAQRLAESFFGTADWMRNKGG